jgi:hypothetical protein
MGCFYTLPTGFGILNPNTQAPSRGIISVSNKAKNLYFAEGKTTYLDMSGFPQNRSKIGVNPF